MSTTPRPSVTPATNPNSTKPSSAPIPSDFPKPTAVPFPGPVPSGPAKCLASRKQCTTTITNGTVSCSSNCFPCPFNGESGKSRDFCFPLQTTTPCVDNLEGSFVAYYPSQNTCPVVGRVEGGRAVGIPPQCVDTLADKVMQSIAIQFTKLTKKNANFFSNFFFF